MTTFAAAPPHRRSSGGLRCGSYPLRGAGRFLIRPVLCARADRADSRSRAQLSDSDLSAGGCTPRPPLVGVGFFD